MCQTTVSKSSTTLLQFTLNAHQFYLVYILFKVTFNNISVTYVTAHICAGSLKKKLDPRSGSHAINILQGSLKCPSKHRHGANLFMVIPRNRPISVAFNDAHGDQRTYSRLKPQGGKCKSEC